MKWWSVAKADNEHSLYKEGLVCDESRGKLDKHNSELLMLKMNETHC